MHPASSCASGFIWICTLVMSTELTSWALLPFSDLFTWFIFSMAGVHFSAKRSVCSGTSVFFRNLKEWVFLAPESWGPIPQNSPELNYLWCIWLGDPWPSLHKALSHWVLGNSPLHTEPIVWWAVRGNLLFVCHCAICAWLTHTGNKSENLITS